MVVTSVPLLEFWDYTNYTDADYFQSQYIFTYFCDVQSEATANRKAKVTWKKVSISSQVFFSFKNLHFDSIEKTFLISNICIIFTFL